MKVDTQIISFDSSVEEIENNFRLTVKELLERISEITESRVLEKEVVSEVKRMLDVAVTPNSPIELNDVISWGWKVGLIDSIGGGAAGKLTLYVADMTLRLKEKEGVTQVSVTSPTGKTLHVKTTIIV